MSKSTILLTSINNFYNEEKNRTKLMNILDKTSGISLRNLEWFITNYAKKNNTMYTTHDGKLFTVHCAYKSSLDGYSKKLFDTFFTPAFWPCRCSSSCQNVSNNTCKNMFARARVSKNRTTVFA